jgi:LacI family transcriptional regulator
MLDTNSPPSLKSLAASLGLSAATVSRVLSGQAERYRISAATRDRILATARTSGLVVNHLARSLRLQRTLSIGLLIPDLANPLFALLAREIERSARRHGYSVLVADSEEDPAVEAQALALLLSRNVDGLILAPVGTPVAGDTRRALGGRPCVLIDRLLPELQLPAITSDHRRGAELAVAHLLDRGHRCIACVQGKPGTFANDERVAGWRAAMTRARLPCGPELVFGAGDSLAAGSDAARALLKRDARPSAVLALGNLLALGVLQAVREGGLAIPGDLSLVAFDDQPWTGVLDPPLTIIEQPIEELGRQGLDLLLERIATRGALSPTHRTLPVRLIERQSVRDLRRTPHHSRTQSRI